MNVWVDALIAIVVAALLGAATTFYFRKIRLPREETAAGIAALAAMRWRDFVHLVLEAMSKRGYERVTNRDAVGDESDFVLKRDDDRWLLSTNKHGTAYILGTDSIDEFANAIRLSSTTGGLLVTPGHFTPEAKPRAALQHIELLDGPTLWPELRQLIPADQRTAIVAPANERARRHVLVGWGAALVVAALVFVFDGRDAPVQDVAATPANTSTQAAAETAIPAASPVAIATVQSPAASDAAAQQRRIEIADAISTLPVVDRATWSTQSTLLVNLLDDRRDPMTVICPLLQRHQELRATRVQLQPPAGSTQSVRFVQCQAY